MTRVCVKTELCTRYALLGSDRYGVIYTPRAMPRAVLLLRVAVGCSDYRVSDARERRLVASVSTFYSPVLCRRHRRGLHLRHIVSRRSSGVSGASGATDRLIVLSRYRSPHSNAQWPCDHAGKHKHPRRYRECYNSVLRLRSGPSAEVANLTPPQPRAVCVHEGSTP